MNIQQVVAQSKASIESEDLDILLRVLVPRNPKVILEIGTSKGYSANVWRNAFSPRTLITMELDAVDKHPDRVEIPGVHYLWGSDSHDPEVHAQVRSLLNEDQVDFLFIDGDHSYNGVRKDFEMYARFVRDGGVVAFQDVCYLNYDNVVRPYWEEMKRSKNDYMEIRASGGSTGIGVLFCRKR